MEGFEISIQAKPRFPSVGELREAALSRVTEKDIEARIIKLKADANVAIHNCDKALRGHQRSAPGTDVRARHGRSLPMEHSHHAGSILDVR